MAKQYRPWAPEQAFLLPPSPMEWLPQDHLAYFVLEVVQELDLAGIEDVIQEKDGRGERPFSPRMMTALIVYAYSSGVFSSRKIERATHEDVAFRVIAGGAHPHFTSINRFRLQHRKALAALFGQVLQLCARAGLKTVGHVALDGSKVQANASKHKAMSYGRMKEEEKRLQAEIEGLLQKADAVDAAEDAEHGEARGDEVPEELRHRETRLRRIRELKLELEKEAAESRAAQLRDNAEELHKTAADKTLPAKQRAAAKTFAKKSDDAAQKLSPRNDDDDDDNNGTPSTQLSLHRVQTTPDGKPTPKAQRNFTDADSRIMIRNGVFMQAYNAQAAVSGDQIVVAHGVTNDPTDAKHLAPMLERVAEAAGALPTILTADAGYFSEANVTVCAKKSVDAYIAVRASDAAKLTQVPDTPRLIAQWDMSEKLKASRGRAIYALRKIIVEPVFGQIKAAMGFSRFSLRGLSKAESEWGIVCLCHNLLKLFRASTAAPA